MDGVNSLHADLNKTTDDNNNTAISESLVSLMFYILEIVTKYDKIFYCR